MDKKLAVRLFQIMITSWICGATLQHLFGAPDWIIYFCAFGMGVFWIESKPVDKKAN